MHTVYNKTAGFAWIDAAKTVLRNGTDVAGSESPIREVLDLFVMGQKATRSVLKKVT
ncbi:MAG TPA: hypothetical protein VLA92_01535 [Candidatus Saccharimonadales bacterium]|nr:hypothetical protein [Candidatus Saccharimonadales bacterium]